jgi:protein-L-isoaspartate(D-aspartate) O-methyltransferase
MKEGDGRLLSNATLYLFPPRCFPQIATNERETEKEMKGWIIPLPREPTKSREEFEKERTAKVRWLARHGYVKSERIKEALLKVSREDFIPRNYRDYAYREVPLPLPGEHATISCPHSYPLFYEPLGLDKGHKFLEVGLGSGYGAAVAREIVGADGLVVSVEIDPATFEFGRRNLENAGYDDIVLVKGDGGLGYPEMSPYHRISVTAACIEIPHKMTRRSLFCWKKASRVWRDKKSVRCYTFR